MAVGFSWAAVAGIPLVWWLWPEGRVVGGLELLGLIMGLGLLLAALPYSLDQVVLRMAGTAYFALLRAILPMVATVMGAVFLAQWLSWIEVANGRSGSGLCEGRIRRAGARASRRIR
ncbi:hypothetical protein CENDO_07575 [Corynebacterium endometrii]|uniref:Uncharacterized protein n=1 Tax=Corynebacterium endometrii TaxID=2488819 RepID=A0A4P7QGS4_9CORY|nr:hypothetical protein CENDO_07575 [Corynebacterium endometrii]